MDTQIVRMVFAFLVTICIGQSHALAQWSVSINPNFSYATRDFRDGEEYDKLFLSVTVTVPPNETGYLEVYIFDDYEESWYPMWSFGFISGANQVETLNLFNDPMDVVGTSLGSNWKRFYFNNEHLQPDYHCIVYLWGEDSEEWLANDSDLLEVDNL